MFFLKFATEAERASQATGWEGVGLGFGGFAGLEVGWGGGVFQASYLKGGWLPTQVEASILWPQDFLWKLSLGRSAHLGLPWIGS